jgi:hypothetical protein
MNKESKIAKKVVKKNKRQKAYLKAKRQKLYQKQLVNRKMTMSFRIAKKEKALENSIKMREEALKKKRYSNN